MKSRGKRDLDDAAKKKKDLEESMSNAVESIPRRNTRQRKTVLDAVRKGKQHLTADEVYLIARSMDPKISRGTVYRNLAILAESGELLHVRLPIADRYDYRTEKHYHIRCLTCGEVIDAPVEYDENLNAEVSSATGYELVRHRLLFDGICAKCKKEK